MPKGCVKGCVKGSTYFLALSLIQVATISAPHFSSQLRAAPGNALIVRDAEDQSLFSLQTEYVGCG